MQDEGNSKKPEPSQHKHPAEDFLRATKAERAVRAEKVRAMMIYPPPPDTGKARMAAQDNEQERNPPPPYDSRPPTMPSVGG